VIVHPPLALVQLLKDPGLGGFEPVPERLHALIDPDQELPVAIIHHRHPQAGRVATADNSIRHTTSRAIVTGLVP